MGSGAGAGGTAGATTAASRGSEAVLRHHAGRAMAAPSTRPSATSTIPFSAGEPAGAALTPSSLIARDDPHRQDSTRGGTRRPHVEQTQLEVSEGGIARRIPALYVSAPAQSIRSRVGVNRRSHVRQKPIAATVLISWLDSRRFRVSP